MTFRPVLTSAERERQRKVARLSSARAQRFGPMPADPQQWWQQLEQVAADLGLAITPDEFRARPPMAVVEGG